MSASSKIYSRIPQKVESWGDRTMRISALVGANSPAEINTLLTTLLVLITGD